MLSTKSVPMPIVLPAISKDLRVVSEIIFDTISNCGLFDDYANFSFQIKISFPLITILVDKKNSKQNLDQWPIIFPPNKTIFWGKKKAGKNIIQIKMIPM